ncbi:MAG: hypothetical protein ABIK28_16465, partial [Planctomycetota bacterium]
LYLYRGLIFLQTRQPQQAFEPLKKALERDPGRVETYLALSYAYHSISDTVNGELYFRRAEEYEISSALGWLLRGFVLKDTPGDGAIESYNRAIALRPNFTPALEVRAFCRADRLLVAGNRAELDPMLKDYDTWVNFQPQASRAFAGRAVGWLKAAAYAATQKDLLEFSSQWIENSRADLEQALALKKDGDYNVKSIQGSFLRYINDLEGSADAFGLANQEYYHATNTDNPAILHQQAISLHALGDLQGALERVERALEIWPDNRFPVPLQRALLLAELGRLDEARAQCRTILHPEDRNAIWLFPTTLFMELLGDFDAASEAVQQFDALTGQGASMESEGQGRLKPALDYLMGRIDADALMQAAGTHPGLRCELAFFVALRELAKGHREAGMAALETCKETGVYIYVQYRFTQIFQACIRSEPAWPAWISDVDTLPSGPR